MAVNLIVSGLEQYYDKITDAMFTDITNKVDKQIDILIDMAETVEIPEEHKLRADAAQKKGAMSDVVRSIKIMNGYTNNCNMPMTLLAQGEAIKSISKDEYVLPQDFRKLADDTITNIVAKSSRCSCSGTTKL